MFGLVGYGIKSTTGRLLPATDITAPKAIVVSRSHAGSVEDLATKVFNNSYKVIAAGGSGYKVLQLINKTAEIYVHTTAIKKWDTCAGDALIRTAGGSMIDLQGADLTYLPDDPVKNEKGLLAALANPFTYFKKIEPYVGDFV